MQRLMVSPNTAACLFTAFVGRCVSPAYGFVSQHFLSFILCFLSCLVLGSLTHLTGSVLRRLLVTSVCIEAYTDQQYAPVTLVPCIKR